MCYEVRDVLLPHYFSIFYPHSLYCVLLRYDITQWHGGIGGSAVVEGFSSFFTSLGGSYFGGIEKTVGVLIHTELCIIGAIEKGFFDYATFNWSKKEMFFFIKSCRYV